MGSPESRFSAQVERCFSRGASAYPRSATLQAAVATRLAQLARPLATALPSGPRADLGAGSGLLSRALETQLTDAPLLRLDACAALLEQEQPPQRALQRLWDLNQGLPQELEGPRCWPRAFALQWLEQPALQLSGWCKALRPGGALVLAVPCSGSFQIWHHTAERAGVPCSAPSLTGSNNAARDRSRPLALHHHQLLRFSRPNRGARAFLRQIKTIGAQASPAERLQPGQLRQLIRHWPGPEHAIVWHVLVLVGQKR